jgi:predicted MFS family arabinose efflux permease
MVTMTGFLAALAAPLSIVVAGRADRRKVLLFLLALLAASNLVVATAGDLVQLFAGRVVLGFTVGGFWTISGSLGPRLRKGAEGIRANAVILSGVSIGTVAGVPAGALIGDLFGWRIAFGAAAALSGLAIAALLLLLPPIPAEESSGVSEIPAILRNRRAQIGLGAAVLAFVGQFTAYTYIAPFLAERSGISGGALSAILLASGAAGFVGNAAGGWMSARNVKGSVLVMATITGAAILLLDIMGHSAPAAVLLVIVWGFAFGMLPIAMQSWMSSTSPDHLDSIQALFVTVAQGAIASGALVGGAIADLAGVDGALLIGGVAAIATAAIVALSTKVDSRQRTAMSCDCPA